MVIAAIQKILRRGSAGDAVLNLQANLNQLQSKLAPLAEDGIFGAKTQERVKEFQVTHQLAIDGLVGPKTLGALQSEVDKQSLQSSDYAYSTENKLVPTTWKITGIDSFGVSTPWNFGGGTCSVNFSNPKGSANKVNGVGISAGLGVPFKLKVPGTLGGKLVHEFFKQFGFSVAEVATGKVYKNARVNGPLTFSHLKKGYFVVYDIGFDLGLVGHGYVLAFGLSEFAAYSMHLGAMLLSSNAMAVVGSAGAAIKISAGAGSSAYKSF